MYGPDEHRGIIGRVGALEEEANGLLRRMRVLRMDAFDADPTMTQDCRDFLREAIHDLGGALANLDNAKHGLPTPSVTAEREQRAQRMAEQEDAWRNGGEAS